MVEGSFCPPCRGRPDEPGHGWGCHENRMGLKLENHIYVDGDKRENYLNNNSILRVQVLGGMFRVRTQCHIRMSTGEEEVPAFYHLRTSEDRRPKDFPQKLACWLSLP